MEVPESQFVEHKQSLGELKDIIESVAAFATCQGGTIRIGIRPNGDPVGVQIGRTTLEDLARDIKLNTDPPQFPSITYEGTEASAVIVVRVDASTVKPVFAHNRPIKRVGRTNQKLSRAEVQRLIEETTGRTWDTLPCYGFTLDGVDAGALSDFARRAGQDTGTDAHTVISNLAFFTHDGEICNGAALLFARELPRFIPNAQVKCARFIGTTPIHFLDEVTLTGPLLLQLEEAMRFVTRNTRQAIRITGKPERDIIPEYPTDAVREAIANAICHRSYTDSGTVQVRIFDDRLEVWNPGTLPPELSIDSLYKAHASRPRNPRFAQALHIARLIEHWGTGTLRMIDACAAHNLPRPVFALEMGSFIVTFLKELRVQRLPHYDELNNRQRDVLRYLRDSTRITNGEYQQRYSISARQSVNDLDGLVHAGFVIRGGAGRATYYQLVLSLSGPGVVWDEGG